jgi:hypothetical protein
MAHMKFRRMSHCAFCTNRPGSKEHAWPKWLIEKIADTPQQLMGHVEGHNPNFDPYQRAIQIPCVCGDCNTQWMARTFEDTARPLLIPLIDDIPTKLDIPQQATIAAWVAKTAMIFEFVTHEREMYYTDAERRLFRASTNPFPPSYSAVWLGRFDQGDDQRLNFLTVGSDASGMTRKTTGLQAYATTMIFGHLAIHIVTVRSYEGELRDAVIHPKPRNWGSAQIRIWPCESIRRWPPEPSFSVRTSPTVKDLHLQFDNPTVESGGWYSEDVIKIPK